MNFVKLEKDAKIGRYTIFNPDIGKGASGPVCLALDANGERCVIKFLLRSDAPKYSDFFRAEFKRLTELEHPNIAKAKDFGEHNGVLYLVTEFIEGENLYEATYYLSPQDSIPLFLEVLNGLDYFHKNGFIHLDIKPENILVHKTSKKIKIIDLGTATSIAGFKNLGQGTVPFIAPEIVLSLDNEVDGRADLFSFGATAYYCLTRGRLPFIFRNKAITAGAVDFTMLSDLVETENLPPPPSESRRDVPEYLDKIIQRLLSKKPKERVYSNARVVMQAMHEKKPFVADGLSGMYLRPIGDQHIGRKNKQAKLQKALEDLAAWQQPLISSYCISGKTGLGKTHLLNKLYRNAVIYPDKVFVSKISFPASAEAADLWSQELIEKMSQNKRAALILIDDADKSAKAIDIIMELEKPVLPSAGKPVLLCYTTENDSVSNNADKIILKPFSQTEVGEFLKLTPAFLGKRVPENWIKKLHIETDGNPNELVEHLHHLETRGLLFDLDGNIAISAMESSVSKATRNRLLRQYLSLSHVEKQIVELLAVWNWRGVAREITRADITNFIYSASLGQGLELLREKGIILQLAFVNPQMTNLVYEHIPSDDRALTHDAIANYLKRDIDGIMLHKGYGSSEKEAIKNLGGLGNKLLFWFGEAELSSELFKDALRLAGENNAKLSLYLNTLLMDAYYYADRYETVLNLFKTIKTDQKTYRQLLILKVLPALIELKDYNEAARLLEDGKKLCANKETPLAIKLYNMEGALLYKRAYDEAKNTEGFLKKARGIYEKTCQLEQSLPENAVINNGLGTVLRLIGENSLAIVKLLDKLAVVKKHHNLFEEFLTCYSLAEANRFAGCFSEAKKYCDELFNMAHKGRKNNWLLHAHDILANLYYDTKKFKEAIEEGNKCLLIGRFLKDGYDEIHKRLLIRTGYCHKELKEFNEAVISFERVINLGGEGIYAMMASMGLAEVSNLIGNSGQAADFIQRAEKITADIPPDIAKRYMEEIKRVKEEILCPNQQKKTGRS
jgi:serine/threonine protein kinase/tetratricopeptide (TPR) repeat protein